MKLKMIFKVKSSQNGCCTWFLLILLNTIDGEKLSTKILFLIFQLQQISMWKTKITRSHFTKKMVEIFFYH